MHISVIVEVMSSSRASYGVHIYAKQPYLCLPNKDFHALHYVKPSLNGRYASLNPF
jgi:hypothetical protein